ncbi:DUF456 domain-containing protein [Rhodococcus chondri]|uniref:DUF456 domain-containing protein n=1 Tax=Rhodococcus chondri TaxID=3065941 RepID=A0ABU7JXL3_9NOCA|nr:DUF456 domain-containing protein [Rhodococcus sp. CC-R104]MEE2034758.1 DUF456 domain-containing protein [Rhodococcus sp. CC-R104]
MSAGAEVLVGLVIAVGLIGIVVPILPGTLLIFGAIAVWAFLTGGTVAWTVFGIATAALLLTAIVKYTWPGKRLQQAGVPNRSLVVGGLLGIIGFFVVPVIGLLLGFLLGMYLSEAQRHRTHSGAWRSTVQATKAVGLSILVELFGALVAAGLWLAAVVFW